MNARTLVVTTGALAALVGGTVQPAGAGTALARSHALVGHTGAGWTYPVSVRKVLVVGNGTRAPYYASVPVRVPVHSGGGAEG